MKKLAAALLIATAVLAPKDASARTVSIRAQIAPYRGPAAFLAIYITKPDGSYHSTLWVAGRKQRYYRSLRDWIGGVASAGGRIDGVTGASVGAGQTLSISVNIADALIDAGYAIHVDSAVEDGGAYPSDAVVPLSRARSGAAVKGRGYVASLTVGL